MVLVLLVLPHQGEAPAAALVLRLANQDLQDHHGVSPAHKQALEGSGGRQAGEREGTGFREFVCFTTPAGEGERRAHR